ncbi:hypothetical protein B0J14DRAFT_595338 [Halenospora varia]|nr:hypothetical protein B0J14DRAFT_595338 [Halenospora varia]
MISLRNLFEKLVPSTRPRAGTEAKETATASQLLCLPPETILLVAAMLPTPAVACLALCSRRLSHILGSSSWRSLRGEAPDVRLTFLASLENDLPQHFVCQECVCLHRMSTIEWPRVITRHLGPRCMWQSLDYRPLFRSRYKIYFPHIQLAIRHHYCGTDNGLPLEAFQHLEVENDQTERRTTLLSINAQIVSKELLIRSQTWILLPWSRRDAFIDELVENSLSLDICVHTRLGPIKNTLVSDLVRSRLDQLEAREKCQIQTLQCPYCWMDYTLDVVDFGEQGFAVLATRWINLGAGIGSADTKWQSHITVCMARDIHQSHTLGEIQVAFEDHAELSVEDLTTDNKQKLFSRRQNRLVCQGSDGHVWRWDQGKWWYLAPSGPPERNFWQFLMDS